MFNKYKLLVAPIVALVAIAVSLIFDVDISQETQNQFTESFLEVLAIVVTLVGVIKNNIKKD